MPFYIGPWQWRADPGEEMGWNPPGAAIGAIDIRPISEQAQAGGNPGNGLFLTRRGGPQPGAAYKTYGNLRDSLTVQQRSLMAAQLGLNQIQSTSVINAIEEMLTIHGRPEADTFNKPLMPNNRGRIEIVFGPTRRSFDFRRKPHIFDAIRETIRQDVLAAKAQGVPVPLLRKWAGALMRKMGMMDHRQIGFTAAQTPMDPDSRASDDFNRANSNDLGGSWTDITNGFSIVTNGAQSETAAGSGDLSRFDTDMATDDHYAEADIIAHNAGSAQPCAAARVISSAAETCYIAENRQAVNQDQNLRKFVAGAKTYLAMGVGPAALTPSYTLRCECAGSTIRCKVDGNIKSAATDATLSGPSYLRGGLRSHGAAAGNRFDNFAIADIIGIERILVSGGWSGGFD